jgi:hypothetical protein
MIAQPRSRAAAGLGAAGAIAAAILALAFAVAPRSCEGGLELYFGAGVAALVALFAIPFFSRADRPLAVRFAWALGFLLAGAAVWVGGFAAADVKLLCRLF